MYDSKSLRLDHFRAYDLDDIEVDYEVKLRGQFDDGQFRPHRLVNLEHLSNPVSKNREGILDPHAHLNWYRFDPETPHEPLRSVTVAHQFGEQELVIGDPEMLLVPTEKIEPKSRYPKTLDHYKCYRVEKGENPKAGPLSLADQFLSSRDVGIVSTLFFCVPVSKIYRGPEEPIHNEKTHLVIFGIEPRDHGTQRESRDQFDTYALNISETALLAVPCLKLSWSEA